MYPDEVNKLTEVIEKRKKVEYLMQLAIVHNPYSKKPEKLFDRLQREDVMGYNDIDLDKGALSGLKSKLKAKSKSIQVK